VGGGLRRRRSRQRPADLDDPDPGQRLLHGASAPHWSDARQWALAITWGIEASTKQVVRWLAGRLLRPELPAQEKHRECEDGDGGDAEDHDVLGVTYDASEHHILERADPVRRWQREGERLHRPGDAFKGEGE